MINLKGIIEAGRFQSGLLGSNENIKDPENLSWGGSAADSRGFIRRARLRCEDNKVHDVIQMHPKWVNTIGEIMGNP